ncbi:helix-turn-helix domain-containing protein [Pseudomonas aeruginosa]|uniref:helix-turn-helix domain-containing protein n=1 Tax=Pseudomonas aeruginosa TaxID=287 RepID=UPI003C2B6F36
MLNPVWLKSLVAIVQTGSFQSAARALGWPSRRCRSTCKLEEQVGVTLVQRGRSGCQPSPHERWPSCRATALLDMRPGAKPCMAIVSASGPKQHRHLPSPAIRAQLSDDRK